MNRNKSFMKTLIRNGPKIEPWGTPLVNFSKSYGDLGFSLFVYDLLNNHISFDMRLQKDHRCEVWLLRSQPCGRQSNALDKSI